MPNEQENARVWHWIRVGVVVSISFVIVLALTIFVLPHMGHGAVTFNESENDNWGEIENRTTTAGNLSFDGLPANKGTTFMITTGDSPPADWGYPAEVTVEHMGSNTTYLTTACESENFTLDLEDGERYRFLVESPNGKEHSLGVLEYTDKLREPVEIVAFTCCDGGGSHE